MKTPATNYKPGHFTEPVYKASREFPKGFPPEFSPTPLFTDLRGGASASQRCSNQRDAAYANGVGWGAGTIAELKGSGFQRPGWMGKA